MGKLLSRIRKLRVEVIVVLAPLMCASAFAQQQTVLTNVATLSESG